MNESCKEEFSFKNILVSILGLTFIGWNSCFYTIYSVLMFESKPFESHVRMLYNGSIIFIKLMLSRRGFWIILRLSL